MIERHNRIVHFICDICGNVLDTGEEDWPKALAAMRSLNWRSKSFAKNEWAHYCDDQCWSKR